MGTEGGEGKIRAPSGFGCQQGQSKERYTTLATQNTQLQKSLPSTDLHLSLQKSSQVICTHSLPCLTLTASKDGISEVEQSELEKSNFLLLLVFFTCGFIDKSTQSLFHSKQHQGIQAEYHSLLLHSSEGSK